MRTFIIIVAIVAGLYGFFFYFRWSSSIKQPIPFSHSQHVQQKISCDRCHKPADANYLTLSTNCTNCHADKKIPADVKWIRVYRVAPDIIFDHAKHQQTPCSTCHVEMTSAQRWVRETRFAMNFCMNCHSQQAARNDCKACHKYM